MRPGDAPDQDTVENGPSRRSLLRGGALVGAGVVGGGVIGSFVGRAVAAPPSAKGSREPFYGLHQTGITTDTQRNTVLAAFDLKSDRVADLAALLRDWTKLAAELTTGSSNTVPMYSSNDAADRNAYADATQPSTTDDSLEAYLLGPQRLTLTVGFGRSLFVDPDGQDRMGLKAKLPPALAVLPHFPGDQLTAADSEGDLYLQACADDPQVAFHAIRSIARIAPDVAALRWTQLGFTPTNDAGTPRNLMGFKDGTVNSNVHPPADLDATVWAGSEGPAWMRGGSYLVYRRIRMALEHWDRLAPSSQEQVIGRHKLSGAPLGGHGEFSALDLSAKTSAGDPVIPQTAHVRLASPQANNGAVIMRRAFAYNNGTTPFTERWPPWRQSLEYDAGLLFLAYQKDPRTAFVPINARLAENDAMNEFITHTASAVFAVPPGATQSGDWIGRTLLT
ncbi:Dyp-type peroxidase [Flexivirga caeni]|uniref:Dyp-type peroxidase n=2 Tax=Flexivirga caeni TaxID=2294115 RepID=A0A3M9M8R6_9MICO|nr:Dyp-type peroxidase [Flexivirga caeni]